jgi:hypothetical protein
MNKNKIAVVDTNLIEIGFFGKLCDKYREDLVIVNKLGDIVHFNRPAADRL